MSAKTKVCKICGRAKPVAEYCKATTSFGGDGYRKTCRACEAEARASRAGQEEPAPVPQGPTLKLGVSLGFEAVFDGTDFVVTQTSGEQTVTMWLSPYELARLAAFGDAVVNAGHVPVRTTAEGEA